MYTETDSCNDFIAAAFSRDFLAEGLDHNEIERIRNGTVDEWILALVRTGLFPQRTIATAQRSWQSNPHSLLDALLTDADDTTSRRYENAWNELTHTSPADTPEYA